jgi:NADH/NAD ratio-sensing transcriptional regulator Rex
MTITHKITVMDKEIAKAYKEDKENTYIISISSTSSQDIAQYIALTPTTLKRILNNLPNLIAVPIDTISVSVENVHHIALDRFKDAPDYTKIEHELIKSKANIQAIFDQYL